MLEVEGIDNISDEMRAVAESEYPELAHKLPPKKPQDCPQQSPANVRFTPESGHARACFDMSA